MSHEETHALTQIVTANMRIPPRKRLQMGLPIMQSEGSPYKTEEKSVLLIKVDRLDIHEYFTYHVVYQTKHETELKIVHGIFYLHSIRSMSYDHKTLGM